MKCAFWPSFWCARFDNCDPIECRTGLPLEMVSAACIFDSRPCVALQKEAESVEWLPNKEEEAAPVIVDQVSDSTYPDEVN
jgi:hypothetical protein